MNEWSDSAPANIHHRLRDLIVNSRLTAGSRMIEADLAAQFGVSRTPVRRALLRLQQEGYIVVAGGGSHRVRIAVAPLSRSDLTEMHELLGHLGGMAARNAARLPLRERQPLVGRLRALNESMRVLPPAGSAPHPDFLDLDRAFPQEVIAAAAGPLISPIAYAIRPQRERYWRLYAAEMVRDVEARIHEHDAIIAELESGRPTSAERRMRDNCEMGTVRSAHIVRSEGDLRRPPRAFIRPLRRSQAAASPSCGSGGAQRSRGGSGRSEAGVPPAPPSA